MKSGQILVLLLGLVVSGLLAHDDGGGSETRLSFSRWVNLLRYVHKTQQREPVADHVDHFNRTEHVELISTGIRKHFFNDHIKPVYTEEGVTIEEYRVPVDLLILLDSSASVGSDNFNKATKVLTDFIDILEASAFTDDKIRVGMISFSEPDKVEHEFKFSTAQDKETVMNQIKSTEYHNGTSTSTAQALWLADSIFSKHSRGNATRVILLATDGWSQNELQLPFGVLWPAARLRKLHGVHCYVIGIGDQINHNELVAIASRPTDNHLFEVEDYSMMLEIADRVRESEQLSEE